MNENNILNVLKPCFEKVIPTKDVSTKIMPLEFAINLVFCYFGDSKTFSVEVIRRLMIAHLNKSISRSAFWKRLSRNRLKQHWRDVVAELMGRLTTSFRVGETILKPLGVSAI